jgi:hypothetical protein
MIFMGTEQEIIAYKPDLNIYGKSGKISDSGYASESDDITYSNESSNSKTRSLRLFLSNSPSSTVNSFLSSMEDVNGYLRAMEGEFTGNKYESEYLAAKTEDEINGILDKNKVDIDFGSDKLETYSYLKKIYEHINKVLDLYMKCVFGDNVNPADADIIVKEYLSKIQALEANYEYEKVNYASLYYDTLISYALSDFISVLSTTCYDLKSIKIEAKGVDLDTAAKSLIKKTFNKETVNLDSLNQSLSSSIDDLIISIKNFYLEKQEFLSYLDTFTKISSFKDGKTELAELKNSCKDTMQKRFDNLVKAYMNYNLISGDVSVSALNKAKYRSFFQ